MKIGIVIFLTMLLWNTVSLAASHRSEPKLIGTFGNWRAYKAVDDGQPVCYMTLTTRFPQHPHFLRGNALLTVTHRPREASRDVLSFVSGYNYKPMSSAYLTIGKTTFDLFTATDTAWSRDAATDHKIAALLRTASHITVAAQPVKKGMGRITDTIQLKGTDEAYHATGKACGVAVISLKSTKVAAAQKPAKSLKNTKKH